MNSIKDTDISTYRDTFKTKVPQRLVPEYNAIFDREPGVIIHFQNEVPEAPKYAMCVADDHEFWIDCYPSIAAAKSEAAKLGLKVLKVIKNGDL